MCAHNIPFSIYKKENHTKFPKSGSQGIISWGFKNEFETAVVNEPSVFEPSKFYCICCTHMAKGLFLTKTQVRYMVR